MRLHDLKPSQVHEFLLQGSVAELVPARKTSGRGQKGQKARSGGGVRRGFEEDRCRYSSACPSEV